MDVFSNIEITAIALVAPIVLFYLIVFLFIRPIRWIFVYAGSRKRLREMAAFLERYGVERTSPAGKNPHDGARAEAARRAANAVMEEHDELFRQWPGFLFFLFRRKWERYPVAVKKAGQSIPPNPAFPSRKEFSDDWMRRLFDHQIVHQLSPLEEMRKELRSESFRGMLIALGGGLCVGMVFELYLAKGENQAVPLTFAILSTFGIYQALVYSKLQDRRIAYRKRFKEKVFPAAARLLDADVRYAAGEFVSRELFSESGLFEVGPETEEQVSLPEGAGERVKSIVEKFMAARRNIYNGSDRFYKERDEEGYDASIVLAQRIEYGPKGSKTRRSVFSGFFFTAPMKDRIPGTVYGFPEQSARNRGGRRRVFQDCPEIPMGDKDFRKKFVCYATDPVEAHLVLTPEFRRAWLELQKKSPWTFQFSVKGDRLFIAFSGASSLVKVPLYGSILKFKKIKPVLELIGFVTQIPKVLGMGEEKR